MIIQIKKKHIENGINIIKENNFYNIYIKAYRGFKRLSICIVSNSLNENSQGLGYS